MDKHGIFRAIVGAMLLATPAGGFAQSWVPGAEITGQSIQVETNGVTNTVYFDPGGVARIQTPSGDTVPGTWAAANSQLCLTTGAAQECWPYAQPFQAARIADHCAGVRSLSAASTRTRRRRAARARRLPFTGTRSR